VSVLKPRRVSVPFRVLAGALGPGMGLAGVYIFGATVYGCVVLGHCPGAGRWVVVALACVGNLALGALLIGTARSGEDPFVSDITEDEDEP
jgi:hypothetical protein